MSISPRRRSAPWTIRTVVALPREDKDWLDARAAAERVPMTALVRRAVRELRQREAPTGPSRLERMDRLVGAWPAGDGLLWQRQVRDEWER